MEKDKKLKIMFLILLFFGVLIRIHYLFTKSFFVNDQGRDLLILSQMLLRKRPVLIGPSTSFFTSIGNLPFGPHYYYFLFPFFLFSKKPEIIGLSLVLIYFISILFLIKSKKISNLAKVISLILITFSINSIYYSTFIWNLNVAMVFGFSIFLIFLNWEDKLLEKPILLFLLGIALGSTFQMHYGTFFLVTGLSIKLFFKKTQSIIYLVLGIILSFIPFLIFEVRHNFLLTKMATLLFNSFPKQSASVNIKNTFVTLSRFYFPAFINSVNFHILLGIIASAIIFFNTKKTYGKILLPIFFLSFMLFKRDFNYYLALYMPIFYVQFAEGVEQIIKKNKVFTSFALLILLIYSALNIREYLMYKNIRYSIKTQNKIAIAILEHNKDKDLSLSALPHDDDKKGVMYLLSNLYKFKIMNQNNDNYIICYEKNLCKTIKGKTIFENEGVKVIYQRK